MRRYSPLGAAVLCLPARKRRPWILMRRKYFSMYVDDRNFLFGSYWKNEIPKIYIVFQVRNPDDTPVRLSF